MDTVERTGKTVDEAIEFALKELDADREEVRIDVVSEGKAGILGIGGEPARVRATLIEADDADDADDIEERPADADEGGDTSQMAADIVDDLLELMEVDATAQVKEAYNEEVDGPVIDIDGEDAGLLIGRRGETLRSLQYLVSLACGQQTGERVNILIDVAGYQERRYNSLRNLARRVARRVAERGRAITLEPMPANERRIVHLTLANSDDVSTASVGQGDQRKVVIEPLEE